MDKVKKRKHKNNMDFILLLVTLLLVFIGVVMVFSSSWPEGINEFNNQYYFFRKQLISAILGLIALYILSNINYRIYDKLALPIFIISMLLGLAVIIKPLGLGVEVNGATRWLSFAKIGIPFQFMPSDVMKLAGIIYFASVLRKKRHINKFFNDLMPLLIIIGIPCGIIILQKDLSTTITVGATMMSMLFIAGIRAHHLLFMISSALTLVMFTIIGEKNKWRMARILSFTKPFENMRDKNNTTGWQLAQSLMALGSGGLFGTGLGKSRQKFFYLPEAHNDFIFAVIGEELGFVGVLSVIILIGILVSRGVRIAVKARDPFGRYLATGITALIAIQSLINLAVVTGLIPTTGIPLPFISYGGTSLMIYMASIGILLNISKYQRQEERN